MKIEKKQERGLRTVHNNYTSSYSDLLQKSGKDLMYVSRLKKIATFVFKSINDIGPDLTNDMLKEKHLSYSLRDNSKVTKSKPSSTKYGINCIAYLKMCSNVNLFYSMGWASKAGKAHHVPKEAS